LASVLISKGGENGGGKTPRGLRAIASENQGEIGIGLYMDQKGGAILRPEVYPHGKSNAWEAIVAGHQERQPKQRGRKKECRNQKGRYRMKKGEEGPRS